jgi:4-hydroxy-tetrahydrodipicolinate reductase
MTGAEDAGLRIGLFGAGRLGSAIAAAAGDQLAWQVAREVPPAARVDAAIEASSGETVAERLRWALATHTPLVIGSTGWELPDLEDRVAGRIGVVVAPNFSLGVALLRRFALALARFCAADETRDPWLVEHHHARKHDAPSGTAKLLARTLLDGCPRKREWALGGPVREDQLAVAVIRAGTNYSEHTVGMDAPAEVIELTHRARSAAAYAAGALAAAKFVRQRRGVFSMDDVARAELEPLFAELHGGAR